MSAMPYNIRAEKEANKETIKTTLIAKLGEICENPRPAGVDALGGFGLVGL